MNQPTMRAKTCTPLLPSLPRKRLKVAKKELDSENELALGLRGDRHTPYQGGIKGGSNPKSIFNLIITSYLQSKMG